MLNARELAIQAHTAREEALTAAKVGRYDDSELDPHDQKIAGEVVSDVAERFHLCPERVVKTRSDDRRSTYYALVCAGFTLLAEIRFGWFDDDDPPPGPYYLADPDSPSYTPRGEVIHSLADLGEQLEAIREHRERLAAQA
jgi:hypothetical protein